MAEDVCVSSPLAQRHDHEAIHGKLDHLSNGLWEISPRHSCIRAREIASVSRDQERQGEEQGCSPAALAAWWAAHMLGRLGGLATRPFPSHSSLTSQRCEQVSAEPSPLSLCDEVPSFSPGKGESSYQGLAQGPFILFTHPHTRARTRAAGGRGEEV